MASILPLISEMLPMIMPSSTHIVRVKDTKPIFPTVEGPIIQRPAIVHKSSICASVLMIHPSFNSSIRHNSEQYAILYLVSGSSVLLIKHSFEEEPRRHALCPGDFVSIPAWTGHRFCNESDEDVTWLVVQSGSSPVGADLNDWGGSKAVARC